MAKKVTINEIARQADVSKGTVSKVLNNKPGIGEKTRRRVMDLVTRLEYHPSPLAQALAGNRTGNIGLMIPFETGHSFNGPYWSSLITAVTHQAALEGYTLMLFSPRGEGQLHEVTDSLLETSRVDGLIIGSGQQDISVMEQLEKKDLPFVLVGQNPDFPHPYVDVDNRGAARSMTLHMIDHGFKKIGYISGPRSLYYNRIRVSAYKETMEERGLIARLSEADQYTPELAYEAVDSLLESFPDLDGIFIGAGGDFLYDILKRLKEKELDLDSMGLAVFDDYPHLDFMEPRLTAVKQPLEELGTAATHLLLKLIRQEKQQKEIGEILQTSITVRGSCSEDLES